MNKIIKKLQHKYALSEKGAKDMLMAFVACVCSDLAIMLPVGLLYKLVADLINNIPLSAGFYIPGIFICAGLIFIVTYWKYNATFLATYVESGVRRVSLAERLRLLPLSFYGKKDLADLTSTIMSDCERIEKASSHFVPAFIGSMISTVLVGASLFLIDWRMALAAFWVLPVSLFVVACSTRMQHRMSGKAMDAKMACADGIQECLETLRDLRANNATDDYLAGLDKKISDVEKRTVFSELSNAVMVVSAQLVLRFGIATVALTGAALLADGSLNVLTFFMFLLIASRLYDPLSASLENLAAIISMKVPCDRMNEILEHEIQKGEPRLSNVGYDIKFDNVGFSYDTSEKVLDGVSFTARQGEVTALIGPSGGGKTTVSRLAARFWDASKGRITVGGMDVSKVDPEMLLSMYSIVFQDVTLFNNTVMENIRIGRKDASDEEVLAAARMAHCDEFAERLPQGWQTNIGENGCELSGGERQRISIARAFLKNAPIILLDEATASLDVDNETLIQESLSRLIGGKTVLIIAHRMRTVSSADKIVVLKDGVVAQQGTPEQLLREGGFYSDMLALQTQN